MTRWEYVQVTDQRPGALGKYGQDGWEAYAVTILSNRVTVFHLKRPLPEQPPPERADH